YFATTMSLVPFATSEPPPKFAVPVNRPATTTSPAPSTAQPPMVSSADPPMLRDHRTAPVGEYFTTKPSAPPALDSVVPPRSRERKLPATNALPAASVQTAYAPSLSAAPIFFAHVVVDEFPPVTTIVAIAVSLALAPLSSVT